MNSYIRFLSGIRVVEKASDPPDGFSLIQWQGVQLLSYKYFPTAIRSVSPGGSRFPAGSQFTADSSPAAPLNNCMPSPCSDRGIATEMGLAGCKSSAPSTVIEIMPPL